MPQIDKTRHGLIGTLVSSALRISGLLRLFNPLPSQVNDMFMASIFVRVRGVVSAIGALGAAVAMAAAPPHAALALDAQDVLYGQGLSRPTLVQAGERLVLLGVTSDNYALVQEGTRVYATELKPHARKQLVASLNRPGFCGGLFV
jgi:hypothetical protein